MNYSDSAEGEMRQVGADSEERQGDLVRPEEAVSRREVPVGDREKEPALRLSTMENGLALREHAVASREEDVAMRESAVTLRESESARDHEARNTELNGREQTVITKEEAVASRESAVAEREMDVARQLGTGKAELTRREQAIIVAEQARDAGFADERAALNAELRDKRTGCETEIAETREKKLSDLDSEIAKLRAMRLKSIVEAESAEQERIREEIAKERQAWTAERDKARKQLDDERAEFERQKGALSALQSELDGRKAELEETERTLGLLRQRSESQWRKRNNELDETVKARIEDQCRLCEEDKKTLKERNVRLLEALRPQTELSEQIELLKRQLGGKDPAEVITTIKSQAREIKDYRDELASRPTKESYDSLDAEKKMLRKLVEELEIKVNAKNADANEAPALRRCIEDLKDEKKALELKASISEKKAEMAKDAQEWAEAELKRLCIAHERIADEEARRKEIENPRITADKVSAPFKETPIDELEWLAEIHKKCEDYGLYFPKRILYAFHTALKTAEWSPLTILAGVSGTGKSELPRLYSHFGGLYFEPLSVQPNWDSQESMLGFFNSIDNKFDAQPVLRFLAQSQQLRSEEYPGLEDAVCLVLLDEMNLAHPELYFAEFLSKLELRRGLSRKEVPTLDVKLGAGMNPYELQLGRNVLWAGTMNQDETTKSLSDKVMDRSIIINFPRPTELRRRPKLKQLTDKNRSPVLHRDSWNAWVSREDKFEDEEILPFKEFIQDINNALAASGRALGHRVWQSIEYYMANHPDVRFAQNKENKDKEALAKALHTAFEDQLVQKVMPKLRGIDTRGDSRSKCLDVIRGYLSKGVGGGFNLERDFDRACDLGYGQFIWQSADYLLEGEQSNELG